jgi:hypothetical protein
VLLKHAGLWVREIVSLVPIYGLRGALRESFPHVLWVETTYRLEKDLRVAEEKAEARIPVTVTHRSGSLDPDWAGQEQIRGVRGEFGILQFENKLDRGDILFCAHSGDDFVGFVWLKLPPVKGAGRNLGDDTAYMFDGHVFEPFRRNRVLPAMLQGVFDYVRAEHPEVRTVVSHAATWHKVTRAGQERAGSIVRARELSVVFLGLRRTWTLETIAG